MKFNNIINNLNSKTLLNSKQWLSKLVCIISLCLLICSSLAPTILCFTSSQQTTELENDLSASIAATPTSISSNNTDSNVITLNDNNYDQDNPTENIDDNDIATTINRQDSNNLNTSNETKSPDFLLLLSADQIATLGLNIPNDVVRIIYKQPDNNNKSTIINNGIGLSSVQLADNHKDQSSDPSSVELVDLDFHLEKKYLFVADSGGSIRRFDLITSNQSDQNELVNERIIYQNNLNTSSVNKMKLKISVDWSRNLLYVAEEFKLFSMDFNGDDVSIIVDDLPNRPECIRVDPKSGYIFWLTKGNFTNTIYSFIDHKNNPIIHDLPSSIELFLIDYKLSRLYVPFSNRTHSIHNHNHHQNGNDLSNTLRGNDQYYHHQRLAINDNVEIMIDNNQDDTKCDYKFNTDAKIMAYNFDGTDRGPVRHKGNVISASSLGDFDRMLDMSIDDDGYFYWLAKNDIISKEYKDHNDECYRHLADNYQDKYKFNKMIIFSSSRQPMIKTKQFIMNRTQSTTRSIPENQHSEIARNTIDLPRHDSSPESWVDPHHPTKTSLDRIFNTSANFTIISFFLVLMGVIIVISLLLNKRNLTLEQQAGVLPSIHGDGLDDRFNAGSGLTDSCIHSRNTATDDVSRYYRPSTLNTGTSYDGDHLTHIAIESGSSNNFDRDTSGHQKTHHINTASIMYDTGLATTNCWPNIDYESNNLYVLSQVLQDDVLKSIPRLKKDELKIEENACLGKGFFGTVYIGTVVERNHHCYQSGQNNINCKSINNITRHSHIQHIIQRSAHIVGSETGSCYDQIMTPSALSVTSSFTPTSSSCSTSSSSEMSNSNKNNNHSYVNSNVRQSSSVCTPSAGLTSGGEGYLTPIHYNCDCQIITEVNHNKKLTVGTYNGQSTRKDFRNTATSSSCYYDISAGITDSNDSQKLNDKLNTPLMTDKRGLTIKNKMRVAIKRLKDGAGADDRRDFLQEAKLLARCNHKNIVTLLGICLDGGSTLIIMELMAGGDLQNYLQERRPAEYITKNSDMVLSEDDLVDICLDIAEGLCYLEERRFVHRDLAARNCLVSSIIKENRVVKISDFGLARDIYQKDYYINKVRRPVPARWLAPECLSDNRYTTKSDVWSYGVLMWEIMTYCQRPYADIDIDNGSDECRRLKDYLKTGERLPRPDIDVCCNEIYSLMNSCWAMEPHDRPSFQECKNSLMEIRDVINSSVVI